VRKTRTQALERPDVIPFAVCPAWGRSGERSYHRARHCVNLGHLDMHAVGGMNADDSAKDLVALIERADTGFAGKFLQSDGKPIPW
jgi:hypothetical protein